LSFLHLRWNRGKRSIAFDLRKPEGAEVFLDVVRGADIVLEGMRAGALAKRGLGYERLPGGDFDEILRKVLGYDGARIAALGPDGDDLGGGRERGDESDGVVEHGVDIVRFRTRYSVARLLTG
jgi:hypothetical protein